MVNPPHEAMHHIFRHDLHLFSRLKGVLGLPLPTVVDAVVLPNDLTETKPVERRVDTLLRLDSAQEGSLLLAIEAQGKKDPAKPASWAYYVSYLWTKYGLPTALLVVCQDRATAEWAARPVVSGPAYMPTLSVRPVVVGPHNMPFITDPATAAEDLALTALSAITHASDPDIGGILKALSTALRDVPESVADPIIEFTAQGLSKRPAQEIWRTLVAVDLSFYKSYLSEELRDEGRVEGRAEGRADAILLVLEQRGLDVPAAVRARVTSCDDPELLRLWLARAVTVATAEEIFETGTVEPGEADAEE
ncbi:hypothetical protein ACFFSH_19060 [Streptomyces filamentosus]|uniref:Transposase (putative) YhgA-like domain-containing protein n=1 Tax=Streptomyces filamentosus TaxID=67294 RepID=A0A919EL06_STRFL|nr:hypothetical protein [Streptomyces filamentosus]GHF91473.1 hypothetical protein GCM10017667_20980 [Streptomyces filamentosus]